MLAIWVTFMPRTDCADDRPLPLPCSAGGAMTTWALEAACSPSASSERAGIGAGAAASWAAAAGAPPTWGCGGMSTRPVLPRAVPPTAAAISAATAWRDCGAPLRPGPASRRRLSASEVSTASDSTGRRSGDPGGRLWTLLQGLGKEEHRPLATRDIAKHT